MGGAVEDIVPKVNHEGIHAGLEDKPSPSDRGWAFIGAVREEDGVHWTEQNHGDERLHSLADTHVRYTITRMFVPVEESNFVAEAAENTDLVNGIELEGEMVVEKREPWRRVAEEVDIELVEDEGEDGVGEDPNMELHLRCIRDLVGLLMNWDLLIKLDMVRVQNLDQPVGTIPLRAIPQTPGGRHRVLWVAHWDSHCQQNRSFMGTGMSTTSSNPRKLYIHRHLWDTWESYVKQQLLGPRGVDHSRLVI